VSKNIARRGARAGGGAARRFNTCIVLTGVPEESRKDATIEERQEPTRAKTRERRAARRGAAVTAAAATKVEGALTGIL
jgi:hypothetical protein